MSLKGRRLATQFNKDQLRYVFGGRKVAPRFATRSGINHADMPVHQLGERIFPRGFPQILEAIRRPSSSVVTR
jgi:hypothetical protein